MVRLRISGPQPRATSSHERPGGTELVGRGRPPFPFVLTDFRNLPETNIVVRRLGNYDTMIRRVHERSMLGFGLARTD